MANSLKSIFFLSHEDATVNNRQDMMLLKKVNKLYNSIFSHILLCLASTSKETKLSAETKIFPLRIPNPLHTQISTGVFCPFLSCY